MNARYQDIYPSAPELVSTDLVRACAANLLTLEYFEAEPGEMSTEVFSQHHILLNLKEEPHTVENVRNGQRRVFEFKCHEVVVTPAGVRSGWRWHARSKVIVVTLEPDQLERFAQLELGVLLTTTQLEDCPQFHDPDLCRAGVLVKEALEDRSLGHEVLFESLARVFLVKLIKRYGETREAVADFSGNFTSQQYKQVLDFIADHYAQSVSVEALAKIAGLSPSRFSSVFKETIGQSPHRFVMSYRVEQAQKKLRDPERPLSEIALTCGFSDQAHFSRVFKQHVGFTPNQFRRDHDGR